MNPIKCPECGRDAWLKVFGPFFTPEGVHRFAIACPNFCWRGRMCETAREAVEACRTAEETKENQ